MSAEKMIRIEKTLFRGGTDHVLTMSYDDGTEYDRRLVELFNRYGIRGSFHLISGRLDHPGYITSAEVATLYQNHEVSSHTVTHQWNTHLPDENVLHESLDDRKALEALCGYVVRGMSYPYGDYDARTIALFRACGIEYSRTTHSTMDFNFPADPLTWHPTCASRESMMDRLEAFYEPRKYENGRLLYIWGHSFEFDRPEYANSWDLMEEFCKRAAGHENTWYATNIEIIDYRNAQKALRVSANGSILYNPTFTDVWVKADGQAVCIPAGQTVKL